MTQDELNLPGSNVPPELRQQVTLTTLDRIYNWSRRNSVWPLMSGLACCAIEMICTAAARYDFARFGMEVMRPSPRQADVMIISGTVTKKMIPQLVRLYNQMAEPKYVVAMGACASGGGPFKEGYNVVSGVDKYMPVDVYIPGCPPTPQSLLNGLIALQKKIDKEFLKKCAGIKKILWGIYRCRFWVRILWIPLNMRRSGRPQKPWSQKMPRWVENLTMKVFHDRNYQSNRRF